VRDVDVLPVLRRPLAREARTAVEAWATVAWLLAVEGRALVEDIEGGVEQPAMQHVAAVKLLELLADVDARLSASAPVAEVHLLAVALEHGMPAVLDATGDELVELFGVADGLDGGDPGPDAVTRLFDRIADGFPGDVPNPLLADGQGPVLRALRSWGKLANAAAIDASFLEPFLKDA